MTGSYIYDAVRTPFGRHGKSLAGVRPDDLAAANLQALMARHQNLDPALIDDVILGDANQAGEENRNVAHMASLLAGLPTSVPGTTVNHGEIGQYGLGVLDPITGLFSFTAPFSMRPRMTTCPSSTP